MPNHFKNLGIGEYCFYCFVMNNANVKNYYFFFDVIGDSLTMIHNGVLNTDCILLSNNNEDSINFSFFLYLNISILKLFTRSPKECKILSIAHWF